MYKMEPLTPNLEGMDAVVHLAGESIDGRWTKDKKARIYNSRKDGTALIAQTLPVYSIRLKY